MKRIAVVVSLAIAIASTGCGASQRTSHPMTPATALMLTGVAAGTLGLLLWAGSACEHCDDDGSGEPRPYPYPPPGEW